MRNHGAWGAWGAWWWFGGAGCLGGVLQFGESAGVAAIGGYRLVVQPRVAFPIQMNFIGSYFLWKDGPGRAVIFTKAACFVDIAPYPLAPTMPAIAHCLFEQRTLAGRLCGGI